MLKHILITGSAGFIASNLIKKLLIDEKYFITGFDNFDDFYSKRQKILNMESFVDNKSFTFIEGDIRNQNDLKKIGKIDIIVHLAAKAGVRPSIENPSVYQDVNINGTQNLLDFAHNREIKQFIFASSSSVYGVNEQMPWNENERLLPISPYASTKLYGEMLGHVYSYLYDIRFIALRFFTVYGPGQRPDLAIHKFFKSILSDKPIPVFGDGSTSRDYTYIDDIIDGIIAAINYEKSNFEIINLGNNCTVSLNELIEEIELTCEKKAIIDRQVLQPGDINHTYADINKAQQLLGYNPKISLKVGLSAFNEWYKSNCTKIN